MVGGTPQKGTRSKRRAVPQQQESSVGPTHVAAAAAAWTGGSVHRRANSPTWHCHCTTRESKVETRQTKRWSWRGMGRIRDDAKSAAAVLRGPFFACAWLFGPTSSWLWRGCLCRRFQKQGSDFSRDAVAVARKGKRRKRVCVCVLVCGVGRASVRLA